MNDEPKLKAAFVATLKRRTQDADGEWSITLSVPMSEEPNLSPLAGLWGKVVKVEIVPGQMKLWEG